MKTDLKLIADESRHWAFDAAEALRPIIAAQNGIPEFGDTGQRHLIYMLDTMQREPMSATKACRWLGWIQAALVANGAQCLADMKAHNKRFSGEAKRVGAAVDGWLPIESAPRDGTEVWAFNGEQGRVRWISGADYALWAWADEVLSDVDPEPEQPTHWRPLPPPPTQEGGGNNER